MIREVTRPASERILQPTDAETKINVAKVDSKDERSGVKSVKASLRMCKTQKNLQRKAESIGFRSPSALLRL